MTANHAALREELAQRVALAQRLLEGLGHEDCFGALRHAEEMRAALRVIHTWASVPGALDARHVRELTARALHRAVDA